MKNKMRLWILEPKETLVDRDNPWEPWYDKTFGVIVRAENEGKARDLAATKAGEEGFKVWLNKKYSSCLVLNSHGKSEAILVNYASA